LLDSYQQNKPLTVERAAEVQQQLDKAALIRDEVVIAAVYPLEALLRGLQATSAK